jgi:hypothetical protein
VRPAPGAPNVLVVVLDDVGFGDFGCYGSELHTPTFDALAEGGVTIKSVGLTEGADAMVFAQGSPKEGRFVVVYGAKGRCIAALSFDSGRWLPAYAEQIAARAPFPPIRVGVDLHGLAVLQPGFPEERTSS